MRCFPNIAMVLVYLFLTSLPITIYATQSITSNERITTASGVKLRNLPQSKAQEVTRLRLGTVVTVVGTSTSKEKIGTSEDFWYSVKTADGKTGWLFGSFTAPFDAGKREQTYLKLAQDRLKLENKTFGDLVDLHLFLKESVVEVKSLEVAAELEFMRLQVLQASLNLIPDAVSSQPGHNFWLKENINDIFYGVGGGVWHVNAESYWRLEQKYHSLPIAERMAWHASKLDLPELCEGHPGCQLSYIYKQEVKYLQVHPKGAHANDAISNILNEMKELTQGLKANDGVYREFLNDQPSEERIKTIAEAKKQLARLRKALIDELVIPRKAELATQLDLLIKALS